jgi:hypothetical protein
MATTTLHRLEQKFDMQQACDTGQDGAVMATGMYKSMHSTWQATIIATMPMTSHQKQ